MPAIPWSSPPTARQTFVVTLTRDRAAPGPRSSYVRPGQRAPRLAAPIASPGHGVARDSRRFPFSASPGGDQRRHVEGFIRRRTAKATVHLRKRDGTGPRQRSSMSRNASDGGAGGAARRLRVTGLARVRGPASAELHAETDGPDRRCSRSRSIRGAIGAWRDTTAASFNFQTTPGRTARFRVRSTGVGARATSIRGGQNDPRLRR